MRTKIVIASLIISLFPVASFAAPLTNEQASSLVGVVQSSPETPASAFTDLITTFSNITVRQAESLITVIKAAPSAPVNAFVAMLIAFTEDTQTDKVQELETRVTEIETKVATPVPQPTPEVGGIMEVMKTLTVEVTRTQFQAPGDPVEYSNERYPYGEYWFHVVARFNGKGAIDYKGSPEHIQPLIKKEIPSEEVVISYPDDHNTAVIGGHQLPENTIKYTDRPIMTFGPYIPTEKGTKTITFTSGDVVESVTIEVE